MVDVSVATMEALMAHHGTCCPARKYWLVVCCFRPNHAPAPTTATRYATMMTRSSGDKVEEIVSASHYARCQAV